MLSTLIRRQANRDVLAKRFNAVGKEFSRKRQQFVSLLNGAIDIATNVAN